MKGGQVKICAYTIPQFFFLEFWNLVVVGPCRLWPNPRWQSVPWPPWSAWLHWPPPLFPVLYQVRISEIACAFSEVSMSHVQKKTYWSKRSLLVFFFPTIQAADLSSPPWRPRHAICKFFFCYAFFINKYDSENRHHCRMARSIRLQQSVL